MSNKISVALCTYNGEKYIKEQLESILNQTRRPNEIIISDDNSSDNTITKIKEVLNRANIEWALNVNSENIGVTKNFEKAINLCTGDLIFTCDQDDVWIRNKIEKIESVFALNLNCNLIFTDAELVDSQLKSMNSSLWKTIGFSNHLLNKMNSVNLLDILLKKNIITGATMAFKKELSKKIMPMSGNWIHDYWIGIIASINGQVIGIPDRLLLYRQHENNLLGVKKIGLFGKIKKYFINFNFDLLQELRESRFNMIDDLLKQIRGKNQKISDEHLFTIIEYYKFWNRQVELKNKRNLYGVRLIMTDMFNGCYRKYYSGSRGVFRDIIGCIKNTAIRSPRCEKP